MRPIGQMIFSTASDASGERSEATQKIIAESPGIPEAVRGEFTYFAHLDGSLLHRPLQQPARFFVHVGETYRLYGRTVAIGHYRGHQRLLTHGLVLDDEHLQALDGNPLLLECSEWITASKLRWHDRYPDDAALPSIQLRRWDRRDARRINDERFDAYPVGLGWTADALQAALCDQPSAYLHQTPESLVASLEWVLLCLPPADRMALQFHTAYSYTSGVPFDLILAGERERRAMEQGLPGTRVHSCAELASTTAPPLPGLRPASARRLRTFHQSHGRRYRGANALTSTERGIVLRPSDSWSPDERQVYLRLLLEQIDPDSFGAKLQRIVAHCSEWYRQPLAALPARVADLAGAVRDLLRRDGVGQAIQASAWLEPTEPQAAATRWSRLAWVTEIADALALPRNEALRKFYRDHLPQAADLDGIEETHAVASARPWVLASIHGVDDQPAWARFLDACRSAVPAAWMDVALSIEDRTGDLDPDRRISWLRALIAGASRAGENSYAEYLTLDRWFPELTSAERRAWLIGQFETLTQPRRLTDFGRLVAAPIVGDDTACALAAWVDRHDPTWDDDHFLALVETLLQGGTTATPALAALIEARTHSIDDGAREEALRLWHARTPQGYRNGMRVWMERAAAELATPLCSEGRRRWLTRLALLVAESPRWEAAETRALAGLIGHGAFVAAGSRRNRLLLRRIQADSGPQIREALEACLGRWPRRLADRAVGWILGDSRAVAWTSGLAAPPARPTSVDTDSSAVPSHDIAPELERTLADGVRDLARRAAS